MTSILYPVAQTPEAALHAPLGFAAREREATGIGAGPVVFVTEAVGPAFASVEAALDAYAGRLEDNRSGRPPVAPAQRWCALRPVSAPPGARFEPRAPAKPAFRDGRRWPAPEAPPQTLWRLSVSYWRLADAVSAGAAAEPARKLRRDASAKGLDGRALQALASQPLRPVRPQQPLDIGLFEAALPEAPDIIVPDD